MNQNELNQKITSLQTGLSNAMKKIENLANEEKQIPKTDMDFDIAKEILKDKEYNVVVCGEVKKGKSSLINAIIGQNLLPVDSDIATSQVFRISNSQTESYKLVFTDKTEKVISREELSKYGSQVDANINGTQELGGKSISYIQVSLPVGFLPEGVNIVDTPGLGSLYKSHEKITQNYISKAAAVVFVLDYANPIVEQELIFINRILDITPYILFVITKTDRYEEEVRNKIITRNEEILREIYSKRNLKAPRIYPISSTNLMKARTAGNKILGMASYHQSGYNDVENLLMRTIYRAVGLLRTDNALSVSVNYVNKVNKLVSDMLQSCMDDQKNIQQRLEEGKKRLQENFKEDSGEIGRKRNEIVREVSAICNSASNRVNQIFSQTGEVWNIALSSIDNISSSDDATKLCSSLPQAISNEVAAQWDRISEDLQTQVYACLSEINVTMDHVYCEGFNGSYSLNAPQMTKSEKVNVFTRGFMGLSMGSAIGGFLGSFFGPIGTAVGAGLGAALGGTATGTTANIDFIKSSVKKEILNMITKMRSDLLDVPGGSRFSKVGNFANNLLNSATSAIDDMIDSRKRQIQEELDELTRRCQMDMQTKQQEKNKWLEVKGKWNKETEHLRELITIRKEIVQILND